MTPPYRAVRLGGAGRPALGPSRETMGREVSRQAVAGRGILASGPDVVAKRRQRSGLRWLPVMVVLAACVAPSPERPATPPAVPAEQPVEAPSDPAPAYDEDVLYALLDAAEQALADDRLLTPEHDSAYHYFSAALTMAPEHPLARRGFERIVESYLALAGRAIERERWASARSMLDRARIVDADHSGIATLRRQVELLANARRESLSLVQAAVRSRSSGTAAQLRAIGRKARQPNARVTIRAASDPDGRWIYEQMNKAPGERRIRASLQIGAPPKVTVLFLDDTE